MSQTKDAYYFFHDSNARNDIKMIKLRRSMGFEGIGLYWCLIEILREEAEYKMHLSAINDISFQFGSTPQKISKLIKSFELFETKDDFFFSKRLIRSMQLYNETKQKFSEAGRKGMQKRWNKEDNNGGAPPLKRIS